MCILKAKPTDQEWFCLLSLGVVVYMIGKVIAKLALSFKPKRVSSELSNGAFTKANIEQEFLNPR
ncbi:MAG: hypothetical protein PUP46_02395 [Endozoicomonas sp. (ex Botrylloides leachii)]|nr:hypothetical protein [Endozoicomonas sp. (ex Botrylloides leachii)]